MKRLAGCDDLMEIASKLSRQYANAKTGQAVVPFGEGLGRRLLRPASKDDSHYDLQLQSGEVTKSKSSKSEQTTVAYFSFYEFLSTLG